MYNKTLWNLSLGMLAFLVFVVPANAMQILFQGGVNGAIGPLTEGDFARFQGAISKVREKNPETLLVSTGGILGPSPVSLKDGGRGILGLLNDLKLDVAMPGPHDFFDGAQNLLDRVAEANFPFVLTNTNPLSASVSASFPLERLKPYAFFEKNGKKVMVFGVICPSVAKDWPHWDPRITLITPLEAVAKYEAKAREADLVILLSNMSFRDNVLLLKKLKWVHVVITNPMTPDEAFFGESLDFGLRDGRRICWTIPGDPLPGLLTLTKKDESWETRRESCLKISEITPEPEIASHVIGLEEAAKRELEKSLESLTESEINDPNTALGNALRVKLNAEISLLPPGLCRSQKIPSTPTEWDIRSSFPYPDRAALMEVDGVTLSSIWMRRNEPLLGEWGFALIGLKETAGQLTVNGRQLHANEKYKVGTTEFIARGGFGLLQADPRAIKTQYVSDLLVSYFSEPSKKRLAEIRKIEKKPATKYEFSLSGSYSQLTFSDGAQAYQYTDPQAIYRGSDIPGLVGNPNITRNFNMHFQDVVEGASSEWMGRIDSNYCEFKGYKLNDSLVGKLRYQKLSLRQTWQPFADIDLEGTNLQPDVPDKRQPFFAKSVLGLSRNFSKDFKLFAGIAEMIRFSVDGKPSNSGLNIGYEYKSNPKNRVEVTSILSFFSSFENSRVSTYDGFISLKFPIFKRLMAIVKQSAFGWKDSNVAGMGCKMETFTGLGYDFSWRRF
ncbi:MAG: bifunctional metallophosphatase/5'-nucleotidase [Candidatus Riflebacteria bacterium]|nr:bifunctional metallophosphatase/5'-nucleotidase [Candidatus Riflebacteria bacterium]